MPGLVPGIHVFTRLAARKTWMAGTSPAMTSFPAYAPRSEIQIEIDMPAP